MIRLILLPTPQSDALISFLNFKKKALSLVVSCDTDGEFQNTLPCSDCILPGHNNKAILGI